MIKKKLILNVFLLVLLSSFTLIFSQNALVERYLSAANREYSSKNYSKAYSYINYVLGEYNSDSMPQNVEILAESVYYAYLTELKDKADYVEFKNVKEKLLEFPLLSSERVSRLVKTMNTLESQDITYGVDVNSNAVVAQKATVSASEEALKTTQTMAETLQKQQDAATKKETAYQEQLAQKDAEYKEQLAQQEVANQEALQKEYERQQQILEAQRLQYEVLTKTTDQSSATTIMIIIAAGCILLVVIIIVIIVVSINMKNSKKQQEQFEATLKVVSQMARAPNERMMIDRLPDIYDTPVRSVGSSSLAQSLPEPELSEEERQEVKDLATKCEKLGAEIDRITGRKNNSKNVSEMVFKICHEMGVSSNTSMLYFCASMVYDAGFLLINPELLSAQTLSEEQKYEIRSHVNKGVEQIGFVPERYHAIFEDAVLKHHENIDGSGYPEGISGDQIPMIARLIHVVETFVSLISRRNYRNIYDKESAISELRKHPEQYDESIVNVLDSLV